MPVGARLWVVDVMQPAAAVYDVVTAQRVALVGWPETPPGSEPEGRRVFPANDGLWVQQPGGPVVLVDENGLSRGYYASDLVLGAVSAHGAWCGPARQPQDVAATEGAPPRNRRGGGELRVLRPGKGTRAVRVDAGVESIRSLGKDLFVEVENGRWSRRPLGTSTSWELVTETSWLRLGADHEVPAQLSATGHGCDAAEAPGPRRRRLTPWLPEFTERRADDDLGLVPDARAGGLDWFVGWDRTSSKRPHEVVVVVVETGSRTVRWRLALGPGRVQTTVAAGGNVWVAVEEPRDAGTYSASRPIALVRIDATTGGIEHVLGPDEVEITEQAWPLDPAPVDSSDYAAFWCERFSHLDTYWTHPDGRVTPLSDGMSDTQVEIVGDWPDTTLEVAFAWTQRPGVRLRRVIGLYDDLGRPTSPRYADINLMEDLDTGHVAPTPSSDSNLLDM